MKYILIITTLLLTNVSSAQVLNWSQEKNNPSHIMYSSFGYDYGITTQLGYGRYIESYKPILLTMDYSFPMGNELLDDFKTRIGIQIPMFELKKFKVATRLNAIFRRHETKLVRMLSFGSEINISVGYFKSSWHITGEIGFDKSINTHLKHSRLMQENYPTIRDGWFIPSGGNHYYGIQSGKSLGMKTELTIRLGFTNAQFQDENSLIPYYTQLGINYSIYN